MLIARGSQSTFKPVPPGSHLARCYRIIDLGTQESSYLGVKKSQHKAMFQFEVHSEDDNGKPLVTDKGEPMTISKNYSVFLGKNTALRTDLESWRGRPFTEDEINGFNLNNVLGHWCLLTVVQTTGNDGREYANISAISPVPKAMKASLPEPFNEIKLFSIKDPDMEFFESLSPKLKEKIANSPEWKARNEPKHAPQPSSNFDDDNSIPF